VSRKEVAETSLVRVRVRSTVPVYTLLYVSRGWADSKNTAVFMDDGHGVQPEALSEAQAISQYVLEIPYRILYVKYGLIPQEL